jgi:hypothetical protein
MSRLILRITDEKANGAIAGHGTSILDPDDQVAKFVMAKCDEILRLAPEHMT